MAKGNTWQPFGITKVMKLKLKDALTGSYPRVPKNLAGHKVILKLSTKSENQKVASGQGR